MPTIATIRGVKVQVYSDDHNPPHFHALSAEGEVVVVIETLRVVRGRMRRSDLERVLAWASQNKDLLRDAWSRGR